MVLVIRGVRSTTLLASSQRVLYQVSKILRPFRAVTWRFLKIMFSAMSISTGSEGIPKRTTVPPLRAALNAVLMAIGEPLISSTTSSPRPSLAFTSSLTTSPPAVGLKVASAPISTARASLVSFRSLAKTCEAPLARAMPTLKSPMGPQPRMPPLLPVMSWFRVANTALPHGSCRAAISGEILPGSFCQITFSGTQTYSAKAPSRSTPRICVRGQRWACPVLHW